MRAIRQALILAAGHGSRLLPLTVDRPKVMLPVAGRPMLEHHVTHLRAAGVTEICLNLHAFPAVIRDHFGDGSAFGVRIHYAFEPTLRGTAGAVNGFRDVLNSRFLVQYGDVYSELDIARANEFHEAAGAEATLVIHPSSHPEDSDIVQIDETGRVTGLHHKPGSARWGNLGNAGCYVAEPAVLDFVPPEGESDFIRDVFPAMLAAGRPLSGFVTTDYLFDMGTPERYRRLQARLESE